MRQANRRRASEGFTLLESIVMLALLGLLVVMGFPALLNTIHRAKVETTVREAAMELRAARLEAVKRSVPTYVEADLTNDRLVVWRESGDTLGFSDDDELVRQLGLPEGLHFWGPADGAPEGPDATFGLPAENYLTFEANGAADFVGAIRFGDGRDNFLELRVDPPATARVTTRKWDGATNRWLERGEGGKQWSWL